MQTNQLKKNVYSCVYENHKVIVHTKGFGDDENKIAEIVCKTLKTQKNLDSAVPHKLSLVKSGEKIEARLDGKVIEISSDRIERLEIKNLALKRLSIESTTSISPTIKNPPPFIVQIFLRFIHWLTGATKTASQEANRFLDEVNCRNHDGLLSLVETWESLQNKGSLQGSKLGKELKQVLSGRNEISPFTQSLKQGLENLKPSDPLMLPMGFYDEKQVFHPLILLFEKKDDKLTMKLLSTDPSTPATITYDIDKISDVSKLLKKMVPYMKSSTDHSPLAQKRLAKVLETSVSTAPDVELQEMSRFEVLLGHFKGFKEIARDPVLGRAEGQNMMMELLSQITPEIQVENTVGATLGLFVKHFERCASKIENYSEQDQILILETLLKEYDQADLFCRQLLATKKSISHLKSFENLSQAVEKIRLRLAALKERVEKTGREDRIKDLSSIPGSSRCKVRMPSTTKSEILPPSQIQMDVALFEALQKAISQKDHQTFLANIEKISEQLNLMVDGKQYGQVIEYATKLFTLLPPPESDEKTFWSDISEPHILPMQKHLSAVVHYMWEAKIFRGDPYSTFEETLGLALAHAGLQSLTQSKATYALETIVKQCALTSELNDWTKEKVQNCLKNKAGLAAIAGLVKVCKLPFSTAVDLLSGSYRYLNEPLHAILLTDRFVVSYDTQKHQIVNKIRKYSEKTAFDLDKSHRYIDYPVTISDCHESLYRDLVGMRDVYNKKEDEILKGLKSENHSDFEKCLEMPDGALNIIMWGQKRSTFFCDLDNEGSAYLTPSLKYLRATQCQSCSILNPENCIGPNFTSWDELLGKEKKWVQQLRNKATEGSRSEQEVEAKMRHLYRQEVQPKLQKMRRLRLRSNSSIVGANLEVAGVSGSEKLGFVFGKVNGFSPQMPHKSMDNVGLVDGELAHSLVSGYAKTDNNWFKNHSRPSSGRTQQNFIEGEAHTEPYWSVKLQTQGRGGAYDLNTMNLDNDNVYHPICCENALQFMLDFPEQLNNVGVRRLLETSLFRPSLLSQAMKDPTFFKERLPRLHELTENALKTKNFDVAFYLMHVVSSIEGFDPSEKKDKENPIGYAACYGERKTSGIDILTHQLQSLESGISEDSIRMAIYFLEAVLLTEDSEGRENLIQKAYSILKSAPKGFDINALQQHVLEHTEKKFPKLIEQQPLVEAPSYQVPFIPEIAKHLDVLRVFSGREVKGVVTEDSPKRLTYLVGDKFQITWLKETKELKIQQKIENDWYTYTEVEASNPVSLDEAIQCYHAWVLDRKAFVICGDQSDWKREDLLEIDISSKGDFLSIKRNGKDVGVDRQLVASKWFSCVHPSRLLFENNQKKELEKISLLGTGTVLERSNGVWKRGQEVLIDPSDTKSLSESAQILLKGIGPAIHDVGLIFKNGIEKIEKNGSEKIEIFPYAIEGLKQEVETGKAYLKFQKEPVSTSLPKPFIVEIKEGVVDTSCAGYLYLAQLCAHQKNMRQALFYLQEAAKKKTTPEDLREIQSALLSLENYHPVTLRETLFKLKAELLISRIHRMHLGVYGLMPENEEFFLENTRQLQQLYNSYEQVKEKKSYGLQELELTPEEIEEYKHISKEALLVLKTTQGEDHSSPTPEEGSYLFNYLIAYATPLNPGQDVSLPLIPDTQLLAYFSIFYAKVKSKEISAEELKPLFAKISLDYPEELRKAIDIARRTLWVVSGTKEKPQNDTRGLGLGLSALLQQPKISEEDHHKIFCFLAQKQDPSSFLKRIMDIPKMMMNMENEVLAMGFPLSWKEQFASDMGEYSAPLLEDHSVTKTMINNAQITQEEKKLLLEGFDNKNSISRIELQQNLKEQKINYVALRKEKETEQRIQNRIERINKRGINVSQQSLSEVKDLEKPDFDQLYSNLFEATKENIPDLKLPQIALLDSKTLEKARNDYLQERRERVQLKDIEQLKNGVTQRKNVLTEAIEKKKDAILLKARQLKRTSPAIRSLLRQEPLLGKHRFLESLLDLYQKAEGTGDEKLDEEITVFLLLSTENNLLQEVLNKTEEYKSSEQEEHIDIATEIKKLLQASCTYDRYKDREAFIAKKLFVAEYRGGVILRKGQLDTIDLLRKNPNLMTRLRMGLGKTTYILPMIMHILAEEKKKLPIALVPDELFNMNRIGMDEATRHFFQQCAYEFNPNEATFSDSLLLAQELDRLYEVKESQGYVIARLSQIARIKQNIILSDEALSGSLGNGERIEIEKRRSWLTKMNALLSDAGTQFCGDEADEIFSVNRDINIALRGTEKPINEKVCFAAHFLVKKILSSEEKDILPLKQALMSGQQAALDEKILQAGLKKLSEIAKEYEDDDQTAVALEKMLYGTLEDILKQNPDVDFGIQKDTGYSVGPRQEKREKTGEKFSNEYEVALYNTIQYAAKGPNKAFLLKALPGFYINHEKTFNSWIKKANIDVKDFTFNQLIEQMADYLVRPENWQERLEILEMSVFKEGLITLTEEEIVMNTHDVIRGKQSGGTSGTGSFYTLPEGFETENAESQDVEAETFIKLAATSPQGFDTKVKTCQDDQLLTYLKERLSSDDSVRAVINIGLSIGGKDADEIVKELQEAGLQKTFIYIDPKDQKPYLKEYNKAAVAFDNTKRVPKGAIVFYDSADKRGVNFKMAPGTVLYLPGPNATKEQTCQGVWRARLLGSGHKAEPLLVESIAKSIKSDIGAITLKDLLDHIVSRSDTTQKTLNLKAEMLKIQGIATLGVEKILYNPQNSPKTNQTLYPIFRNYFVRRRETDFSRPKTGEKAVLGEKGLLVKVCDHQIKTLEESKGKLLKEAENLFDRKLCEVFNKQLINHYDYQYVNEKRFNATFKDCIEWLKKQQTSVEVRKDLQRLESKTMSMTFFNLINALEEIDGLLKALEDKKLEYLDSSEKFENHKQHLPSKVKKTFSSSSGGTAQQLQQQRQQQKQSSMQIEQTSAGGKIKEHLRLAIKIEDINFKMGWGMSQIASGILKRQGRFEGVGTFRLLVVKKDGKTVIRLITKQDHLSLEDPKEQIENALIFSLDRTVSDKNPKGITLFKSWGGMGQHNMDETTLLRISAVRFFLGLSISENEKQLLKKGKEQIFGEDGVKHLLKQDKSDKFFLEDTEEKKENKLAKKRLKQQLQQKIDLL